MITYSLYWTPYSIGLRMFLATFPTIEECMQYASKIEDESNLWGYNPTKWRTKIGTGVVARYDYMLDGEYTIVIDE
jgi:hypothetical protein